MQASNRTGVLAVLSRRCFPLVKISIPIVGGRRWWLAPILVSIWPAFQALRVLMGWQEGAFDGVAVQTTLIGFPLMILAIGLGLRIIGAEIEQGTLEISYTIPGGASRAWLGKLVGTVLILLFAEAVLALWCEIFFLPISFSALYGAFQESLFYLVTAMAMAVWSRSQITGAMLSALVFAINAFLTGFGANPMRISPTFNSLALRHRSPEEVLAFTVQNRVGMALLITAIIAATFSRAERREKMLR